MAQTAHEPTQGKSWMTKLKQEFSSINTSAAGVEKRPLIEQISMMFRAPSSRTPRLLLLLRRRRRRRRRLLRIRLRDAFSGWHLQLAVACGRHARATITYVCYHLPPHVVAARQVIFEPSTVAPSLLHLMAVTPQQQVINFNLGSRPLRNRSMAAKRHRHPRSLFLAQRQVHARSSKALVLPPRARGRRAAVNKATDGVKVKADAFTCR